ncbi:MAG: hypothetical protein H6837_07470 [Planctomycetes bacterium]|nr:hypothetical protein [Planctomycetota bacterium]
MFHTTHAGWATACLALLPQAPAQAPSKPADASQTSAVSEIVRRLEQREARLKSLKLELRTEGSYPNGVSFRTQGTLRVSGGTHFHIRVASHFGAASDIRSEVEKVVTPKGVWTRQKGPVEEAYTTMTAELAERLRRARRELAARRPSRPEEHLPGGLADDGKAALGSQLLAGLNRQFDLAPVDPPKKLGKVACRVLAGARRRAGGEKKDAGAVDPTAVQRVEVWLRAADEVPVQVVQFASDGRVLLKLTIENLEIDPVLDPSSFKLVPPAGVTFQDVRTHRPSWAQIQRLLDDHAAMLAEQAAKDKGREPEKDSKKR